MAIVVRATGTVFSVTLFLTAVAASAPLDPESYPAPGNYIGIGAYRLHINCAGEGSPTVILDAGLGGTSLDWVRVQPAVAKFTRVCSYDRAGYGWSDRGLSPRTTETMVSELKRLLTYASLEPPYVLVGHSLGGFTVRVFANRHPHKIAALVLVDSSHERQFERFDQAGLKRSVAPSGQRSFVISNHYEIPSGLPEAVQPVAQALALGPDAIITLHQELRAIRVSARQARAGVNLPAVPLVVIAHDSLARARTPRAKRMAKLWMEMQAELAARSPQDRLLIAGESGHYVHLEQPDIVIDAIRSVVQESRKNCAPRLILC